METTYSITFVSCENTADSKYFHKLVFYEQLSMFYVTKVILHV